ncbi:S4 domain-containing protein YaaA [Virgibacillus dakarensis]|uniref:RNA-binding protein n=1 Tax=Lentibacillus populi TaxID=1827502 RepID=A0A9W5TXX2_9BACI|nr:MULTISPECIES: S4 domain-containing protein YaaA [Bacillaceae]MBT2217224.1 S4 domain-containing protein YaaA [Virgibacillus dakarensis]MTW85774.1 S4 domain-containing protein YaaA [Virgibacillus dakarensis]GGB43123.1 hypothetical protein GCM10011409_20900 [Lentibacillus populi]
MHKKIEIHTDYITLGQFLKLANIFESGGMIKGFLQEQGVLVNGEKENRRGRKLYENDVVEVENSGSYIVTTKA